MKKLMMAVAAIACAAGVQAATVTWTCKNIYAHSDTVKSSGVAYFLNVAAYGTSADFVKNMTGAGATAVQTALAGAYSWTPSTAGSYSESTGVANATLGLADGTAYKTYLVIFDTATITDSSKFYVTATTEDLTTQSGAFSADVSFSSNATPSQSAANWYAVGVPEPTSGLLLLLGMAGLALKRKHA